MNRKTLSAALACTAMAANSGMISCGGANRQANSNNAPMPAATAIQRSQDEVTSRIERQLSKYEPWIDKLIDTDYQDQKHVKVQLLFSGIPVFDLVDASEKEFKNEIHITLGSNTEAFFSPLYNTIFFSKNWSGILDHEIAHAFTAQGIGMDLVIRLEGYDGPSIKEISRVVGKRSEALKTDGALSMMLHAIDTARRIEMIIRSFGVENKRTVRYQEIIAKSIGPTQEKTEARVRKLVEEYNANSRFNPDLERGNLIMEEYQKTMVSYNEINHAKFNDRRGICKSDLAPMIAKLENLESRAEDAIERSGALKATTDFNDHARAVFGEVKTGSMEEAIAEIDGRLSFVRNMDLMTLASIPEAFARMFDSMMGVYVGEDCSVKFTLNQEELAMFASMKIDGAGMFSKALEKYEIAKRLASEGMDSEGISTALEYAERFEHNGVVYTWKPYEVRFRGKIPRADRITDEMAHEWRRIDDSQRIQYNF